MNPSTANREAEGHEVDRLKTRARKRTAAILLAAAATMLLTTACFPDVAPGEPSDPYAAELFRAINRDRANAGLPALSHSPKLGNLAGQWSWQMCQDQWLHHQDMVGLLYSPDYAAFYTLGENIIVAPGSFSPGQLEGAWMNSSPHRANILSRGFNVMGVGVFWCWDGRLWATVDFGGL
jgi:uncharacterized protein YkwD